jgi:signal-transduction protein with cAMP-binding, CBS, and nucleotidyltransferase domain
MLVTVIADAIAVRYQKNSIMTEKLARRGLRIHQDYEPDVFQQVTVGETMAKEFDTVPVDMRIAELAARIARRDPAVTHHQGVFIVDANGRLAGIITRRDIMHALEQDASGQTTVLQAGSPDPVVTYPNEVLYDAATKMLRADVGRLPVCSWEEPGCPVGYLGRSQILAARLRRLEEEYVREPGWMPGKRRQVS